MSNPFERAAAEMMPKRKPRALRVIKSERDAPKALSPMEKEQRDQKIQLTRYRNAKRAEQKAMLEGEHRDDYRELLALLNALTPATSGALVAYIKRAEWIKHLDAQQQMTVLSLIDDVITRARELMGLPPFDDPLPGQPPNLFLIIRKLITGV